MKRIGNLILLTAMLLLLPREAWSQEPVIHAYTQIRNSGNFVTSPEGELVPNDIGTRLFREIMAEAGLAYDITIAPWARNIQALNTRPNVLAYTFVRSPDREDAYYWVGLVRNIESNLYGLREHRAMLPTTLDEARQYRVGSIRDDAFDSLLHRLDFPNIVHINNSSPWLTLLERGRIDLVPFSEQAMVDYLVQRGEPVDRLVAAVRLEALSTGLYFALSKQTDEALYQRLHRAYVAIVENGTYERIVGLPHPELQQ